ncbi:hypothetical protein D3C86_2001960 [compost metagenome]
MTTGTISAQPSENSAIGSIAQPACTGSTSVAITLSTDISSMITKPWRIWRFGGMRPASRPLSQAPVMMPEMISRNSQKNSVGPSPRWSPRNAGAAIT